MGTRKMLVWVLVGLLAASLFSVVQLYANDGVQPSGVNGPAPEVSQPDAVSNEAAGALPAGTVFEPASPSGEESQVESSVKADPSGAVSGQAIPPASALDLKGAGVKTP